jgi:dihydropteroate synthase
MAFTSNICGMILRSNQPPLVMGILNLSPESFYKKSVKDASSIVGAAQKMVEEGASFLDIGARSTSPWASPISVNDEKERLFSALSELDGNVDVPISVDTMYADVAEGALSRGVSIINDISGFKNDEQMSRIIADYDACAILMATQHVPGDPLGINAVMSALSNAVSEAERAGIDSHKLILDPAIGHWIPKKSSEYDFDIINQFERFSSFEMPILVAASRKSFLTTAADQPADERLISGLVAASIAAYKCGHIVRTHDVAETVEAMRIIHAIKTQKPL